MNLLYEGKAKKIFKTNNPDEVLVYFKDDATAFNGEKKEVHKGKGRVNLMFTRYFFKTLSKKGVKSHIVQYVDDLSFIAQNLNIIPLEVVVRNYAAGSICKRSDFKKGDIITPPMLEFFLKDDEQGDPLISEDFILKNKLATIEQINEIKEQTLKINEILSSLLEKKGITFVDFKLEFGLNKENKIILADEISPDTCRFWKKGTTESLDKDVFREGKGNLVDSYKKLADIVGVKL